MEAARRQLTRDEQGVGAVEQTTNSGPTSALPGGSIEDVLALIENAVDELTTQTTPETLTGWDAPSISRLADAHTRIRRVTGRLDGVRYTLLPRIEDEGSWRSGGMARTFTTWLQLREGISSSTAGKDMTIARRLATALPVTRERLVAGTLGADHARVMTEVAPTSETRTDALAWLIDTRTGHTTTPEQFVQTVPVDFPDPADDPDGTRTRDLITTVLEGAIKDGTLTTGEGMVLREAGCLNADQFRKVARRFATVTDPDTDDLDDDKAAQGEFLDLAKTFGGYHVAGFLTDEHGLLAHDRDQRSHGRPLSGGHPHDDPASRAGPRGRGPGGPGHEPGLPGGGDRAAPERDGVLDRVRRPGHPDPGRAVPDLRTGDTWTRQPGSARLGTGTVDVEARRPGTRPEAQPGT